MLKDIKEFTKNWKAAVKQKVTAMTEAPVLAIFQVGDNEASNRYVRNKMRDCEEVGIRAVLYKYDENVTTTELFIDITGVQVNSNAVVMVQLPLPSHIDKEKIFSSILPENDVDGLTKNSKFKPCTPLGIMKYLDYCGWDATGKHVVIVGRSEIVGRPLAKMMLDADATVTVCHSKTKYPDDFYQSADLIVSAVGKIGMVNCYWVHCPVIDVGINFDENGKLCGDAINKEYGEATPVPGGVGLLTRCALLDNIVGGAL